MRRLIIRIILATGACSPPQPALRPPLPLLLLRGAVCAAQWAAAVLPTNTAALQAAPICWSAASLADMARHTDGLEDFAASLRLWGPDLGAWTPDKRTAALQVRRGTARQGRAAAGCTVWNPG